MNKKFILFAACALVLVACEKGGGGVTSDKEAALQKAMTPYVNNTVIATYSGMADEGLVLLTQCRQILDKVEKGEDYSALMVEAGTTWRKMRKFWEQSEAFLFGPADQHNIDPHIDSWPLDFTQINALLNDPNRMAEIEANRGPAVGALDYALKGFHAAEYFLFESVKQGDRAIGTGKPHAADLTHAEAVYLLGIVEDLVQQTILLEDSWAGHVSAEKAAVITVNGKSMSYNEQFGDYFIHVGKDSEYKTYQEAAEEMIAGCVEIAGEVAATKMGKPYLSSNAEERDYIESPYSCTSTTDFADNIISIRNVYCGAKEGDASISDFIQSRDAELDAKVRKAIEESIAAIEAIEDFENNAQNNPQVKAAIDQVSALEEVLDKEVLPLMSK